MSHADDVFVRNFLAVLGALVLFAIFAFFLARAIGGASLAQIRSAPTAVQERIQPVGKVTVGEPDTEAPMIGSAAQSGAPATTTEAEPTQTAAVEPTTTGAGKSGEQVYKASCIACHAAGVAGAPKLGDKNAWNPRLEQGLAGLVNSVVQGKNAMPPKGGNPALSEEEIKKAVKYMLTETGVSAG